MPILGTKVSAFRSAREACLNYAPGDGLNSIDLGHYMAKVEAGDFPSAVKQHASAVRARLQEAIIVDYASRKRQGAFGSTGSGLTIRRREPSMRTIPTKTGTTSTTTTSR